MKRGSFPDITGQKFGQIIVLDGGLPKQRALIRCECGTTKIVSRYDVFNGKIKSCGARTCTGRIKDLIGRRFCLLFVLRKVENDKGIKNRCAIWECQCDCGKVLTVPSNQLTSGRTKSCGCAKGAWISEKTSLPIKEVVEKQLFGEYGRNAKKRGLDFLLTKKEFATFLYGDCFYCGGSLSNCMTKKKVTGDEKHHFNGVDRVDNDRGYTLDNCVSCCKLCNHAKNDLSKDDFIALVKKIAERF